MTSQKSLPTVAPPPRPTTPVRTVSAFAALESPSTPAKDQPPSPGHRHSDSSRTNSSAGLKTPSGSVFSATLGPSPEIVTSPTEQTTTAKEAHRVGKKMVAAEVKGIGRVALARDFLLDKRGPSMAEKAIPAAAPALANPFDAAPKLDNVINQRNSSPQPSTSTPTDRTLGLMRSWLESDDKSDSEPEEPLPAPLPEVPLDSDATPPVSHLSIGGKTVRVLLQSKKRQASEEAGQIVERPIDSPSSSRPQRQVRSLYGKGKAPARASDEHCFCGRGDDGEPMISCDSCQTWYHLECVHLSPRKTPRHWTCSRCGDDGATPTTAPSKRQRVTSEPRTPTIPQEPVLVETVMSPRTRENFYRTAVEHVVLAPSPQSSPVRRFVPRSPIPPYTTPATPSQATYYSRADYSPRSPLLHKMPRSRATSGVYDEHSQSWSQWDGQSGENGDSQPLFPPVDEPGYHSGSYWHDLTMTPSRSMPSAYSSWSEQYGIHTPMTASKRHRLVSNGQPFSASQEFLTNLHNTPGHEAESSAVQSRHPYHASAMSPLAQKQRIISSGHRRGPSFGGTLGVPSAPLSNRAPYPHGVTTSPTLDRASSPATQYRTSVSRLSAGSQGGRGSPFDLPSDRSDGPTGTVDNRPASAASRNSASTTTSHDVPQLHPLCKHL